jgi:hypothetical protein
MTFWLTNLPINTKTHNPTFLWSMTHDCFTEIPPIAYIPSSIHWVLTESIKCKLIISTFWKYKVYDMIINSPWN